MSSVGTGDGCRGAWLIRGDALLAVNLSQAAIAEKDESAKRATIRLPQPEILQARVDHERTRTWEVRSMVWLPWNAHHDRLRDEVMLQAQRLGRSGCWLEGEHRTSQTVRRDDSMDVVRGAWLGRANLLARDVLDAITSAATAATPGTDNASAGPAAVRFNWDVSNTIFWTSTPSIFASRSASSLGLAFVAVHFQEDQAPRRAELLVNVVQPYAGLDVAAVFGERLLYGLDLADAVIDVDAENYVFRLHGTPFREKEERTT